MDEKYYKLIILKDLILLTYLNKLLKEECLKIDDLPSEFDC